MRPSYHNIRELSTTRQEKDDMDLSYAAEMRNIKPPDACPRPVRPHSNSSPAAILPRQSLEMVCHPYNPSDWIARAAVMTTLGYPELAVGDAHKAVRLCETMLLFLRSRHNETWLLGNNCGFWMRDEITPQTKRTKNDIHQMETNLSTYADQAHQIIASNLRYNDFGEGTYMPRDYPWLEAKHRTRDQNILDDISVEIANNEIKTSARLPCVEVKRCTFRPDEVNQGNSTSFGVFATCNLSEDSAILVDKTDFFGCNGPGRNNCKANLGGSNGCQDPLHPNLDSDEEKHDLRWVREQARSQAADPLILCRVLLACVKQDIQCPLDLPAIARLIPTYHRKAPRTFSLKRDFRIINDALEQFGVDIFANQNYDTWVLFTISARLHNNSWTNPISVSLNPLFSLFNHSCEPNVGWETKKDHRTVVMRVSRDVVAGEQLFVEYDGFVHEQPVHERRKRLARWIDGDCMCSRCVREEEALRCSESADVSETMASPGSNETLEFNTINRGSPLPAWDTSDRPTLPEDAYWASAA